eukprot:2593049-Amphidinium_carterae.1
MWLWTEGWPGTLRSSFLAGTWSFVERGEPEEGIEGPGDDVEGGIWELHTYVGCAVHDCHNSLKWSSYHLFTDEGLRSQMYIGMTALPLRSVNLQSNCLLYTSPSPRDRG